MSFGSKMKYATTTTTENMLQPPKLHLVDTTAKSGNRAYLKD